MEDTKADANRAEYSQFLGKLDQSMRAEKPAPAA